MCETLQKITLLFILVFGVTSVLAVMSPTEIVELRYRQDLCVSTDVCKQLHDHYRETHLPLDALLLTALPPCMADCARARDC